MRTRLGLIVGTLAFVYGCGDRDQKLLAPRELAPQMSRSAVATILGPTSITAPGNYNWGVSLSGVSAGKYYVALTSSDGRVNQTIEVLAPGSNYGPSVYIGYGPGFTLSATARNFAGSVVATASQPVDVNLPPQLSATLTGPTHIFSDGTYTWTASASGGTGSYTYRWRVNWWEQGGWSGEWVGGASESLSTTAPDKNFEVWVTVESGTQTASAYISVCNLIPPNSNYVC